MKMYSMYREIQNFEQNFFLKLSQNFLSESSRMTPVHNMKKVSCCEHIHLILDYSEKKKLNYSEKKQNKQKKTKKKTNKQEIR